MQKKNKALVGALGATAVGAAVVLTGASSAYFIDEEAHNNGSSITAGTLDLVYTAASTKGAIDGPITVSNVKPGWAETYTFTLTNEGSVPGTASLALNKISDLENGSPEMEGSGPNGREGGPGADSQNIGDLGGAVWVNVSPLRSQAAFDGMLYQFVEYSDTALFDLAPGETKSVTVQMSIPDHGEAVDQHGRYIDNMIMTDSYTFDVDLSLRQS